MLIKRWGLNRDYFFPLMAGLKVLSLPLKRFCLLVKIGSQLSQPTRHSEVNGLTRHAEQDFGLLP
jgi:hypothetical protein